MFHKKNSKCSSSLVDMFKEKQIEPFTFNYGDTQVTYPDSYFNYLNTTVHQDWYRRWDGNQWRWYYRNFPQGYPNIPAWWWNQYYNRFQGYPYGQTTPYYEINQDPNVLPLEAFSSKKIEHFGGGSLSLCIICIILLLIIIL